MMNKSFIRLLTISAMIPALIGLNSCRNDEPSVDPDIPVVPDIPVEPETPKYSENRLKHFESEEVIEMAKRGGNKTVDDYYKSCEGLKGKALKDELFKIVNENKGFVSYGGLKEVYNRADVDPNNPNNILLCYTNESVPKIEDFTEKGSNVNREHVWPRSIGDLKPTDANSDAHMVRPIRYALNTARGNLKFASIDHKSAQDLGKGCYANDGSFDMPNFAKGDMSRTLFYMAVAYDFLELDKPSDTTKFNYWSASGEMGHFDHVYKWATDPTIDPIDKFEMNRNNIVDSDFQYNRNPFVDHPEFIEMIWDKTYDGPGALLD